MLQDSGPLGQESTQESEKQFLGLGGKGPRFEYWESGEIAQLSNTAGSDRCSAVWADGFISWLLWLMHWSSISG